METSYAYTTTTAPTVNGDKPLPKRVGVRSMVPSTWLDTAIRVTYVDHNGHGVETDATLLDWTPAGYLLRMGGHKTLLNYDRVVTIALEE